VSGDVLERIKNLMRFTRLARNRVGIPQTRPQLRVSFQSQTLLGISPPGISPPDGNGTFSKVPPPFDAKILDAKSWTRAAQLAG